MRRLRWLPRRRACRVHRIGRRAAQAGPDASRIAWPRPLGEHPVQDVLRGLRESAQGGGRCYLQGTGHVEDPHRDAEQVSTLQDAEQDRVNLSK